MAVDDHGLEVLKKSGEEVKKNDKSDYYLKTTSINSQLAGLNALDQELTTVGTSSIVLTFPEGAQQFIVFHQHDTAKLYFGDSS